MAPKPVASARRLRLAVELRKMRERSGMTATEAARTLGVSQGQLSNIESARFGVSPDRLRAMARAYACSDQAFVEALVDITEDKTRGWWETFRDVLPPALINIAELEHHATMLWSANTAHVPGLLQTTDHAREIFRQVVPEFSRADIEHRVSHRLRRQALLDGEASIPYRAIIHEAALRVPVGGVSVARRQLEHLVEQSEREHITIQVIPFAIGAYPGAGQNILYAYGLVPQLDTISLDQSHGPVLLDAAAQLEMYRILLNRMEHVALKPSKSRDFIHDLIRDL
ncbi:helix-turn-helix domain-containing protein [Streptomyces bluensis]|uniref:helix-turn-helix domain-containing protein n=1 Tax=Streptomyces bluensis TaxID=33897 RepID=UPI00167538D2|nr:helix-turn-helix transcriptional regulator [Streptomyces bluensis]GGZ75493.1 transcriptional regulator [Streptomyces bluensis]